MRFTVRAVRAEIPVSMEGAPRRFIGLEPVEVEATPYYRRQILDGDLVEVMPPTTPTKHTKEE